MTTKLLVTLRVLTFLVGAACIGYGGIVGIVGVWVDGPAAGGPRRFGLLVFGIGLLYSFPVWLLRRRAHIAAYGLLVALPFCAILCLLCRGIGDAPVGDLILNAAVLIPVAGTPLVTAFLTCLLRAKADAPKPLMAEDNRGTERRKNGARTE